MRGLADYRGLRFPSGLLFTQVEHEPHLAIRDQPDFRGHQNEIKPASPPPELMLKALASKGTLPTWSSREAVKKAFARARFGEGPSECHGTRESPWSATAKRKSVLLSSGRRGIRVHGGAIEEQEEVVAGITDIPL